MIHDHDHHTGLDFETSNRRHGPYWKRAHHDWRFWLGVVLMLVGITVYIMTDGFSFVPVIQPK